MAFSNGSRLTIIALQTREPGWEPSLSKSIFDDLKDVVFK